LRTCIIRLSPVLSVPRTLKPIYLFAELTVTLLLIHSGVSKDKS
jgi:hypothetical protein